MPPWVIWLRNRVWYLMASWTNCCRGRSVDRDGGVFLRLLLVQQHRGGGFEQAVRDLLGVDVLAPVHLGVGVPLRLLRLLVKLCSTAGRARSSSRRSENRRRSGRPDHLVGIAGGRASGSASRSLISRPMILSGGVRRRSWSARSRSGVPGWKVRATVVVGPGLELDAEGLHGHPDHARTRRRRT